MADRTGSQLNDTEPSRFHLILPWLPATFTGIVGGFFLARVTFEGWLVLQLSTWPGALGVVAVAISTALALRWSWLRLTRQTDSTEYGIRNTYPLLPFLILLIYVFWPRVNLLMASLLLIAAVSLSLALALRARIPDPLNRLLNVVISNVLIVVVVAAYLQTAGRTVGAADTFEFQVVAPALGIAHPTGYPLLILLGKLFSLIPFGQVAWRVNLVSVTFATLATGLLYLSLLRLTGQRAISALAALCLAFSRPFWSQAVQAEVYPLNAAFVAAILWLLISRLEPSDTPGQNHSKRWLYTLAAIFGLSLTNHLTMTILFPAIALGVFLARPQLSRRDWLLIAGCLLAPLLLNLFVPLRWPALHNGRWMSLGESIAYVTGQQFRGALQWELWQDESRWRIVGGMTLDTYGPVGTVLASVGLLWLVARKWRIALLTLVACAGYWFYGLVYNVPDVSLFIIPAHIIMALWIGVAVAQLTQGLASLSARFSRSEPSKVSLAREFGPPGVSQGDTRPTHWATALAWGTFALLPLSLIWTNGPVVDQSNVGWELYRWGKHVMSLPMPAGSAILADSVKIAPLYYLKRIENERPDIETIVLGDESLYRARLDQLITEGKPAYLARYLPGLAGLYRLHSLGPLVRVTTKPMLSPPPMRQSLNNVNWGGGKIALLGLDVEPGQGNVAWRITLYWLARAKLDENYHVRLRWVGPSGHVWWQDHGAHPVGGYYPTNAWQPGEVIADYHEIPADPTIPPGLARLDVGWFLPFRDEGLVRDGTDSPWFTVALLDQVAPTARPVLAHEMRASFGDELLISGSSDLGVLPPGEPLNVEFEWSRLRPGPDRTLRLRWTGPSGAEIEATQIEPYAGEYPTSQWPIGQSLVSRVTLSAPSSPGTYTLRVGWLSADRRELPARCTWLAPTSRDCLVGTLRVEGQARASGINFDNQVILLDAQIGQTQLRPGETLPVSLKWQGLRQWNADYTVFVHLVGPDGKLHGQVDQWPLDGTLPTRDWQPGRVIDDLYRVTLAGDAPAGTYQVEVGWYLLATLRRLPIVDAEGRPVDDHVIVGTVNVSEP